MTELNKNTTKTQETTGKGPLDPIKEFIITVDKLPKTPLTELDEGETCIYFDCWQSPYRHNGNLVKEDCVEFFIGNIKNNNPLAFYEALSYNSYHGNIQYITEHFRWSSGQNKTKMQVVKVKIEIFEELKQKLGIESWSKPISYNQDLVHTLIETCKEWFATEITDKKAETLESATLNESENENIHFESAVFYDNLLNIVTSQDAVDTQKLMKGDYCINYNIWRERYKTETKFEYENFLEITLGKIKNTQPLTFSKALTLNTYHASLSYSKGNLTWSRGSIESSKKMIPVERSLYDKLRILIKPHHWDKEVSYKQRYITSFVRNIENYFQGQYLGKNFRILQKETLVSGSPEQNPIFSIIVDAPQVADEGKPGQFVVLRLHERGERIPLTIADINHEDRTIRLIYQVVGKTTRELESLGEGDFILDLLGPLGTPVEIHKYDKPVICIGGGVGVASIYSKTKALKQKGNYIISIIGAKNEESIILMDEMKAISDEFYITTDDGLCKCTDDGMECFHRIRQNGVKEYGGFVNYVLESILGRTNLLNKDNRKITDADKKFIGYGPEHLFNKLSDEEIAEVIAVGPLPMMWAVVNVMAGNGRYSPKKDYRKDLTPTLVSLNPIMVDGTGMCGGCRVRIFNPDQNQFETKFTCVDGPCFNGHLVDFESLMRRSRQYQPDEVQAVKYLEIVGW